MPEEPDTMIREDTAEIKIWRCKVCGYLCARSGPPESCPICKVSRDRFERFSVR